MDFDNATDKPGRLRDETRQPGQRSAASLGPRATDVLALQRTAGNAVVTRLLSGGVPSSPRAPSPTSRLPSAQNGAVHPGPEVQLQRFPISGLWRRSVPPDKQEGYDRLVTGKRDTNDLSKDDLSALWQLIAGIDNSQCIALAPKLYADLAERFSTKPAPRTRTASELELLEAALRKLGGTMSSSWTDLKDEVEKWWARVEADQRSETFEKAFREDRMTARNIGTGGTTRGGAFTVRTPDDKNSLHQVTMPAGKEHIKKFADYEEPGNFVDRANKNKLGLLARSASLLTHTRAISEQLKMYTSAVTLFMPVPPEADLQMIAALAHWAKTVNDSAAIARIRQFRSEMTRLKLAQSSDMGSTFVDVSGEFSKTGKFKYGTYGTVIRPEDAVRAKEEELKDVAGQESIKLGKPATKEELAARYSNALQYSKILDVTHTLVNEVVMAYRKHKSGRFPIFAQWDKEDKVFYVVGRDLKRTRGHITDNGTTVDL